MNITAIGGVQHIQSISNNRNAHISAPSLRADSVSFSSKGVKKDLDIDLDTAKFVANSLSTSTSGHRAVYGSDKFNEGVVKLTTLGIADYAKEQAKKSGKTPVVIIGGDTRKGTRESLPLIRDTFLKQGVHVINIETPVPTPLLAYAAKEFETPINVLMTASHNPWSDAGYNTVTNAGAIAPASVTQQIADKMVTRAKLGHYVESKAPSATSETIFPYDMYKRGINELGLIDWDNIRNSNIEVVYDGLRGTGENVMPRLLNDYGIKHQAIDSGEHPGPNPTAENLQELSKAVRNSNSELKIGIANDGDADRFGIVDENGQFINADDVILLTAYHLAKNKGKEGTIIRSQATSKQVDEVANMYGLNMIETPVGFKYIGDDIEKLREKGKDILVAGEESGGLTVNGHIPEKDGIIANLMMLDLVATEQKPISRILADVKKGLPTNYVLDKFNKKLNSEEDKNTIMARAQHIYDEAMNGNTKFDDTHEIDAQKTAKHQQEMLKYRPNGDGVKLFFTDGSTVLVRKSGTEPLVKCYIEASGKDLNKAEDNKASIRAQMDKIFTL